jgi:hypothetical protein
LSDPSTWSSNLSKAEKEKALTGLADSSLLMLADILPTGVYAAIQALNHPKVAPVITGKPWPLCFNDVDVGMGNAVEFTPEDKVLTIGIIGLGPVGICAAVSILDALSTRKLAFKIVAIDLLESRREKMKAVYAAIGESGKAGGDFVVCGPDEAKVQVEQWTGGVGCTTILEVNAYNIPTSRKINQRPLGCGSFRRSHAGVRPCPRLRCHRFCWSSRGTPASFDWTPMLQQECFIRLWEVSCSCYVSSGLRSIG